MIRKVVFPYAFPISDANVSANLVEIEATYPSKNSLDDIPNKEGPWAAHIAQANPVAADPLQTIEGEGNFNFAVRKI